MDFSDLQQNLFPHEQNAKSTAYYMKDNDGRYLFINKPVLQVMRYFVGHHICKQSIIGRADDEIFDDETMRFLQDYDKEILDSPQALERFQTFKISYKLHIYSYALKVPVYSDDKLIGLFGRTQYLNYFTIRGRDVFISKRELDVLVHLVFGLPLKYIAMNLNIKIGSVSTYVTRIKNKLDCDSQIDFVNLVSQRALSCAYLKYLQEMMQE